MVFTEPPPNVFVLHCCGLCGRSTAIPIDKIADVLKEAGYTNLRAFSRNYYCEECKYVFAVAIETIHEECAQRLIGGPG